MTVKPGRDKAASDGGGEWIAVSSDEEAVHEESLHSSSQTPPETSSNWELLGTVEAEKLKLPTALDEQDHASHMNPEPTETSDEAVQQKILSGTERFPAQKRTHDVPEPTETAAKRTNEWETRFDRHVSEEETEEDLSALRARLQDVCSRFSDALETQSDDSNSAAKELVTLVSASTTADVCDLIVEELSCLAAIKCSSCKLSKAVDYLVELGCPEVFVRGICRELRKAKRYNVLLDLAESLVPTLLSKVTSTPSLDQMRQLLANQNLLLVCELGLGGGPYIDEVARRFALDAEEELLSEARKQSAFVLNVKSPAPLRVADRRDFPWFEGMYRLVEEVRGSSDVIWWLQLECLERITARPAKATFAGSTWSGDLHASIVGGELLLAEDGSLRRLEANVNDGWLNGIIHAPERQKDGILGLSVPSGSRTVSFVAPKPSIMENESCRDVTLGNGVFLDTCQHFQFGVSFTIALWFRLSERKASQGQPMTLLSNGTLAVSVENDAIRLENRDDDELAGPLTASVDFGVGEVMRRWHFLCISSSSLATQIYLDGDKLAQAPSKKSVPGSIAKNLYLGAMNEHGLNGFDGAICDVRIWDRPLAFAEMERHRLAETKANSEIQLSAGCIARYPLLSSTNPSMRFFCLENAVDPQRPLCIRPSLSSFRSETVCPGKQRGFNLRANNEEGSNRAHLHVFPATENHQFVWMRSPVKNLSKNGFNCTLRASPSGEDDLARISFRLHNSSWFQHRDHPVFTAPELQSTVLECPAASVSLQKDIIAGSYVLTSAIRTGNGTIANRVKVGRIAFQDLLKDLFLRLVYIPETGTLHVFDETTNEAIAELPMDLSLLVGEGGDYFLVGLEMQSLVSPPHLTKFTFEMTNEEVLGVNTTPVTNVPLLSSPVCPMCSRPMESLDSGARCVNCQGNAVAVAVAPTEHGQWACEACTFLNLTSNNMCEACGTSRQNIENATAVAIATTRDMERVCPVCTVINTSPTAVVCFVCDAVLPPIDPRLAHASQLSSAASMSAWGKPPPPPPPRARSSVSSPVERFDDPAWSSFVAQFLTPTDNNRLDRERDPFEDRDWDTTKGPLHVTIDAAEEVIFNVKGLLEGAPISGTAKFNQTLKQWKIEGSRDSDNFHFELVLDGPGERVVSGQFRGLTKEGAWALGEYVPLHEVLRGLYSPTAPFSVGLQNMITGLTNVCSENAIIQACFACADIRDAVLSEASRELFLRSPTRLNENEGMKVFRALHSLFFEMKTTQQRYIQARDLQRVLPDKYKQGEQMDATEFLSDVMHALEEGLGKEKIKELVRFSRQTELKCISCASTKVTGREDPSVVILPFPKQYHPITNVYVFVCDTERDLPPSTLPGQSPTADVMRLSQPLNGDGFPRVYLYVERDPSSTSALPVTGLLNGKEVDLQIHPGYEQAQIHTKHGRLDPKRSSMAAVPSSAFVFLKHSDQGSPITDIQLLATPDVPVPVGYQLLKASSAPGAQGGASSASVNSQQQVRIAVSMDMPVMDVFVGTAEEFLRRRLYGYTRCVPAVGEEAESGKEVYLFFANHYNRKHEVDAARDSVKHPLPLFNLFVHCEGKPEDNASNIANEEAGEDICGRVATGSGKVSAIVQARTGVGCPVTKIGVFDALSPPAPDSGFTEFVDIVRAEDELSFIFSFEQSEFSPQMSRELRPQSRRFVGAAGNRAEYREVRGTLGLGSQSHSFDGLVYRNTEEASSIVLLGDFKTGHGDLLYAEWSSETSQWSCRTGSSVSFGALSIPLLYELVFTKDKRMLPANAWKPLTSGAALSSGDFVFGRMTPNQTQERPIMRIQFQDVMPGVDVPELDPSFQLVISFTDEATSIVHKLFVSHDLPPSSSPVTSTELMGPFSHCSIHSQVSTSQKQQLLEAGFVWAGDFGPYQLFLKPYRRPDDETLRFVGTFEGGNGTGQAARLTLSGLSSEWKQDARQMRFEFFKRPFEMTGVLTDNGEFIGRYRGGSEARQMFVRGEMDVGRSHFKVRTDLFTLRCVRDDRVRIGLQRDWNAYWEEQKCVFSSRKSNNNVQTMLSLEENAEMLGQQDNLVVCDSEQCRGTRQPHLSIKSFVASSAPKFLIFHIDRIKFDLHMNRAVKDLRKTPPLVAKLTIKSEYEYALCAVVVHIGNSAQSGHYVTYARESSALQRANLGNEGDLRDVPPARWVRFNDAVEVRAITFEEMADAVERSHGTETPYILFYTRCDTSESEIAEMPKNDQLDWLMKAATEKQRGFYAKESATESFLDAYRVYRSGVPS